MKMRVSKSNHRLLIFQNQHITSIILVGSLLTQSGDNVWWICCQNRGGWLILENKQNKMIQVGLISVSLFFLKKKNIETNFGNGWNWPATCMWDGFGGSVWYCSDVNFKLELEWNTSSRCKIKVDNI